MSHVFSLTAKFKRQTTKTNRYPKQSESLKTLVPAMFVATVVGSTLFISGCATKPVYQANNSGPTIQVNARGVPNYYKVNYGDTVSEIAQRYGLNYRQLGALNHLDSRYTIYAGQWLKLWQGGTESRPQTVTATRNSSASQATTYTPYQNTTPPPRTPAPINNPSNSYTATVNSTSGYSYPTSNPVIRNFDANAGVIGMWFSGKMGDPVYASKGGQVLYAGNGLPEYGNLIMIRHDDTYITAYAHNNEILVREGDQVQAGQRIATMGNTGQTQQVALQFQVRENGTPIDPRAVLKLHK